MTLFSRSLLVAAWLGLMGIPARAQSGGQGEKRAESSAKDNEARVNDMAAQWKAPQTGFDYVKRVEMIPMRDGVKLYTVIVVPNGAKNAPMILTRTPYNAAGRAQRPKSGDSPYMIDELPQGDEVFVRAARTSSGFRVGKSARISSAESPAARLARTVRCVKRAPLKTGSLPRTPGLRMIRSS